MQQFRQEKYNIKPNCWLPSVVWPFRFLHSTQLYSATTCDPLQAVCLDTHCQTRTGQPSTRVIDFWSFQICAISVHKLAFMHEAGSGHCQSARDNTKIVMVASTDRAMNLVLVVIVVEFLSNFSCLALCQKTNNDENQAVENWIRYGSGWCSTCDRFHSFVAAASHERWNKPVGSTCGIKHGEAHTGNLSALNLNFHVQHVQDIPRRRCAKLNSLNGSSTGKWHTRDWSNA